MLKLIEGLKLKAKKVAEYLIWVLAVFLVVSAVKNILTVKRIRGDVAREEQKLVKMREENAKLQAQITLNQSQDFIEKQIRNKLGLVKEGEAIVVLPDEETLRKLAPQILVENNALPEPNWVKWRNLFF